MKRDEYVEDDAEAVGLLTGSVNAPGGGEWGDVVGDGEGAVKPRQTEGKVSLAMCVFLMVNSILGSAVLSLPLAAANSGVIPFVLLLAFFGIIASFGLHFLLSLAEYTGATSYEQIGRIAFGRRGEMLVCLTVMIQNTGAMTSYLVIMRSQLPQVLSEVICGSQDCWPNENKYQALLTVGITLVIVLPLCLLRQIGRLAYSSLLSFATMAAFAVIIVIAKFEPALAKPCLDPDLCQAHLFHVTTSLFRYLPTMAFAFVCHTAVLPCYADLKNRSQARMQKTCNIAVLICYTIYLSTGIFAYYTYYGTLVKNVLDNTPNGNIVIQILKFCFSIAVVLTVPIVHFPFRLSAQFAFFPGKPFSWVRHVILTLFAVGILLTLALLVPSIQDVFSVAGATSSVTIMAILPGLFYLRIKKGEIMKHPDKMVATFIVVVGTVVGIGCLSAVVYGFIHPSE